MENFFSGLSFNACAGFGIGAGVTLSSAESSWVGTEDGVYIWDEWWLWLETITSLEGYKTHTNAII